LVVADLHTMSPLMYAMPMSCIGSCSQSNITCMLDWYRLILQQAAAKGAVGCCLLYAARCNSSVTVSQTVESTVTVFQTFDPTVQDPMSDGNQANVIALDIRKRKGLKPNPSPLNEYEDKL